MHDGFANSFDVMGRKGCGFRGPCGIVYSFPTRIPFSARCGVKGFSELAMPEVRGVSGFEFWVMKLWGRVFTDTHTDTNRFPILGHFFSVFIRLSPRPNQGRRDTMIIVAKRSESGVPGGPSLQREPMP